MVTITVTETKLAATTVPSSTLWRQISGQSRPLLTHAVLPQRVGSTAHVIARGLVGKITSVSWTTALMDLAQDSESTLSNRST